METIVTHEHDDDIESYELGKYTKSFGLSFAITSLLSAILVVVKETNEDTVLAWMKAASGHHWVTHGILNLVLFVFFGWLLARPNNGKGVNISTQSLVTCIVASLLASGAIIAGFYLLK
jgi:hypothetical protein